MKTNKTLVAMIASLALLSFAAAVQAQYQPIGKDGIAASPKFRDTLNARASVPAAPAAVKAMACPTCKDTQVTRTDMTARGANKPTVTVTKHLCGSCAAKSVVTGQGKAQKAVTLHECAAGESAGPSCCVTKS